MAIAFGPCMLLAPLVFLVGLLLVPLWPVAIVVLAALWVVVWPVEQVLVLLGVGRARGTSRRVGRWLGVAVRPWKLFDPPAKSSPSQPLP
jgi:hypothetical protein